MPDTTHWIIPAAAIHHPAFEAACERLALPHLDALLARMAPSTPAPVPTDDDALHLPHERAYAQALGLPVSPQGSIPWAAWQRQSSGHGNDGAAWAFVTPCHWQVGTDHITLWEPQHLGLSEDESQALRAILSPWLAEDGITLHPDQPHRWLAQGAPLAHYANASLGRVAGADLRHWTQPSSTTHLAPGTPAHQAMRLLQRLNSEVQMLLHTHPFNEARAERGLRPINALWFHGAGALPANWAEPHPAPRLYTPLQEAAQDPAAWAQAWQALDAGPLAALLAQARSGAPAQITLCSDTAVHHWRTAPIGVGAKIQRFLQPLRATSLLKQL